MLFLPWCRLKFPFGITFPVLDFPLTIFIVQVCSWLILSTFVYIKSNLFYLSFLKRCSLDVEFWVGSFLFLSQMLLHYLLACFVSNKKYDVIFLFLCTCLKSMEAFKIILFFYYWCWEIWLLYAWYKFLPVSCTQISLKFLDLWVFIKFGHFSVLISSNIFFYSLPSLQSGAQLGYSRPLEIVPHLTGTLFIFFQSFSSIFHFE